MGSVDRGAWWARLEGLGPRVRAEGLDWTDWTPQDDEAAVLAQVLDVQFALERKGVRDLSEEVLEVYEQGLGIHGIPTSDERHGWGAYRRVFLLERRGKVPEALEDAEALIEQAEERGWQRVLVTVLRRMGFMLGQSGESGREEVLLHRALALARELADPLEEAEVLRYLGNFWLFRGDPDTAMDCFLHSRALLVQCGADPVRIAQVDTPIGVRLLEKRELVKGRKTLESALAAFVEVDHAWGQTECLLTLGRLQEMAGDLEEGTRLAKEGLAVMRRFEDPRGMARCENRVGEVLRRRGLLKEAERHYRAALQAADRSNSVHYQALVTSNLALLSEAEGRLEEGRELLEKALAIPGLPGSVEVGLRMLQFPFLERQGQFETWEEQYRLVCLQLKNTDRFQEDVALAARRAGGLAWEKARGVDKGPEHDEALSRAVRSHALAWHHWTLRGLPEEEGCEEESLRDLGKAGAPIPLGDFDLFSPLGVGGMGEVWRAVHRHSGVPVAVKVLTAAPARSDLVQASFRAEVRAMASLNHPHVALVLGQGTVDVPASRASDGRLDTGNPYLVMELAPEGSLEQHCGRLPWSDVLEILQALLQGLAHAHARGLLHRDLKPANVLLGQGYTLGQRVRLSDFGLASAMGQRTRLTRVAAGTPAYMAPEQCRARWQDQGPWTDLYALGCLATELVQGAPPFLADDVRTLLQLQVSEAPPALNPSVAVPPGFEAWLRKLLQKQPADRFQRAVEASEALKSLGDPVPRALGKVSLPAVSRVVSASTILFDETLPEGPGGVVASPGPAVREFAPVLSESSPRDPEVRTSLAHAGLSLFGLRILPLVGRDAERQVLWDAFRSALASCRPHAVVIRGPSGIGRSRLANWIGEHAHALAGVHTVSVSHTPMDEPEEGLRSLLCTWLGLGETDAGSLEERLASRGHVCTLEDRRLLSEFLRRVPGGTSRDRRYLRTLTTRMLVEEAKSRPLVLVLDDVQWGDDTLGLATALIRAKAPMLIVLTARDDGAATRSRLTRRLEAFGSHPGAAVLSLGSLKRKPFQNLVREQLGLGPKLARQVEARAHGHPEFAVQLVADWLARGLLQPGEGGLCLRFGVKTSLPDGLQAAWSLPVRRLTQRFGPNARGALEIAAALGQRVDDGEWVAACEAAGILVPGGLMESLLDERLVRMDGSGWVFLHAPFRECLEHLARQRGRLARWHRACAQAQGGDALARRGRHQLLGGRPAEGYEDLVSALEQAAEDLDTERNHQLIARATEALDALGASGRDPRRARLARASRSSLDEQG